MLRFGLSSCGSVPGVRDNISAGVWTVIGSLVTVTIICVGMGVYSGGTGSQGCRHW